MDFVNIKEHHSFGHSDERRSRSNSDDDRVGQFGSDVVENIDFGVGIKGTRRVIQKKHVRSSHDSPG